MMDTRAIKKFEKVSGVVERGHGVASGQAHDSPYPDGTIKMQVPFFKKLGLDLTSFHAATLNVSITPFRFAVLKPEYRFYNVEWTNNHPPEDFSFSRCRLMFRDLTYDGWVYYPHPETKKNHFQKCDMLEIITQLIPDLDYGNEIEVFLNPEEIKLIKKNK